MIRYLYLFASTHDALVAEKKWPQAGHKGRLRPVPRVLSAGCGLSLEADLPEDVDPAATANRCGFSWEGIYVVDGGTYTLWQNPG